MITFRIPMPPTFNTAQRNATATRRYTTPQGKEFLQKAEFMARIAYHAAGRPPLHDKRLSLKLILHFATAGRSDLDNRVKFAQDAIAKGCMFDDKQIDHLTVVRGEPNRQDPHCEVEIKTLEKERA